MFKELLNDIAAESYVPGYNEDEDVVEFTSEELGEAIGDGSDMNNYIEKLTDVTDIADEVDNLLHRTDELVDRGDETLVDLAIESIHNEFSTLMRAYKLNLTASSFESVVSVPDKVEGLRRDLNRVSNGLRSRVEELKDFSTEGKIFREFDKTFGVTKLSMNKMLGHLYVIKRNAELLKTNGVPIVHDGVSLFLSRDDKPVKDGFLSIVKDVEYTRMLINNISRIMKDLDSTSVTRDKVDFNFAVGKLLGNKDVIIDEKGRIKLLFRGSTNTVGEIFRAIPSTYLDAISKHIILEGVGLGIGARVGALFGVGGAIAGSSIGFGLGYILSIPANIRNTVKNLSNVSDLVTVGGVPELEKAINELNKLFNESINFAKGMSGYEDRFKEVGMSEDVDKDIYNLNVDNIKNLSTILMAHVLYMVSITSIIASKITTGIVDKNFYTPQ